MNNDKPISFYYTGETNAAGHKKAILPAYGQPGDGYQYENGGRVRWVHPDCDVADYNMVEIKNPFEGN